MMNRQHDPNVYVFKAVKAKIKAINQNMTKHSAFLYSSRSCYGCFRSVLVAVS